MSQKDHVALVTGASRGIGRAVGVALGRDGATVIGTATTQEGADKISQAFAELGIKGEGLVLNVTLQESIDSLIETLKSRYAMPAILVNNAAVTSDNLFLRMKDEEWSKVIDTNLTSIYRLSRACIRDMVKARWGRIINIGSVVGTTGNAGQVNYSAAKAGLIGFSKSLAQEIGSRNITVNVISPGYIETDMTHVLPEEQRTALIEKIPLQRAGQPDDIAALVVFLASNAAGYITGQTLHVNGGMYMS